MTVWELNLRHLRALASIVRLGSMSAAAQAISISQPAITQALAKLEMQCGTSFFERRPSGMVALQSATVLAPRIDTALAHIGSPRVTTAQMRAFTAVAESGSYAGASQITGLSQPSLHRAVADLAIALRRTLIERRGKGIALTDAGRRTARAFRLAQAELEAGLSDLTGLQGRETGRIVIGAMPLSRARILPEAVARFTRAYPDVAISIVEGSFQELVEPLRDGALDLMIGALREPAPAPDLAQKALFEDRPVVVARTEHPLAAQAIVPLEAFADFPWILPSSDTPLRTQWAKMVAPLSTIPRVPIECGSVITIRQILIDSDFLTLLSPDQVAVELEAGWLTRIADTPDGLSRVIGITTRAGWQPTRMQKHFLQTLEERA